MIHFQKIINHIYWAPDPIPKDFTGIVKYWDPYANRFELNKLEYRENGVLHNVHGHARVWYAHKYRHQFWVHGVRLSKKEWLPIFNARHKPELEEVIGMILMSKTQELSTIEPKLIFMKKSYSYFNSVIYKYTDGV